MAKLSSGNTSKSGNVKDDNAQLARHGLSLPRALLRALEENGIYCFPGISLEHQHLSGRFVLKGTESGGSVESMGRYCGYLSLEGKPLPWLQPLDSFGGNGRHAIVIASALVRIEMVRVERTYDLLITRHQISGSSDRKRPQMQASLVFRGRSGRLAAELTAGIPLDPSISVAPVFHTSAGEIHSYPVKFSDAIRAVTEAVSCIRCKHTHVSIRPSAS